MLWWLSFADDTGFLGVSIVKAETIADAVCIAHAGGCNPGGEVAGFPIPTEALEERPCPPDCIGRLMQRDEIERRFGPPVSAAEFRRGADEGLVGRVCEDCNNGKCLVH